MADLDLGALQIGVVVNSGTAIRELGNLRNAVQQTETANTGLSTSFQSIRQSIQRIDFNSLNQQISRFGDNMTTKVSLPIAALGTAIFKLGADLEETINKVDVIFGENAETVKAWGDTTLDTLGMAKGSALEMTALFGDMGTGMGLEKDTVLEYSMSLTQLSADLASFKNISVDRAKTALTGVYTGETEALKSLGIVMTEVNLQEYARQQGMQKLIKDMTQAEKVMLRYNYVMNTTSSAHGDFERTSDSASNQVRILLESLKELGATIGQEIVPVITPMITELNDLIKAFGDLDEGTKESIVKLGLLAVAIGPVAKAVSGLMKAVSMLKGLAAGFSAVAGVVGVSAGALGALVLAVGVLIGRIVDLANTYSKANEAQEKANDLAKEGTEITWDNIDALDKKTQKLIEATQVYRDLESEYELLVSRQLELGQAMNDELLENGQTQSYLELKTAFEQVRSEAESTQKVLIEHNEVLTEHGGTVEAGLKLGEEWITQIDKRTKTEKEAQKQLESYNNEVARGVQLSEKGQEHIQKTADAYIDLVTAQGLSKEELQELSHYEKILIDMFGDEIIIRDEVGRGIGLNVSLMQNESLAYGQLSEAKRRAINAMAEFGENKVKNLRLETEETIKLLEKQIAAYDASVLTQGQIAVMQPAIDGAKKKLAQLKEDVKAYEWVISKQANPYEVDKEAFKQAEEEKEQTFEEKQLARIEAYEKELETRKYYNDLTLDEELAGYQELMVIAQGNADEQERITRELFRVKREMLQAETDEVKRNCDEQIKLRQEVLNQEIDAIDFGLSQELAELQGELDRLDYEAEQARIETQKKEKQMAIDDAKKRLSMAVTEEERYKASQDLKKAELDLEKFNNDQKIKEERRRIQEEMRLAREKAQLAKDEKQSEYDADVKAYEIARDLKLEMMEGQYEKEFELMTGKKNDFDVVETDITKALQEQYGKRNTAFAQMINNDLTVLGQLKTALQQTFNNMPTLTNLLGGALNLPVAQVVPSVAQVQEAYGRGDTYNDHSTITINNTVRDESDIQRITRAVEKNISDKLKSYRANKGGSRT